MLVDILIFWFIHAIGGRVNGGGRRGGNDIFIPFEDHYPQPDDTIPHEEKTDYFPEDFDSFGEF